MGELSPHYPPLYFYFRDLLACTTGLIVSRDNQTTKPWSFSARTGIHELYILLAKPFEIPNQRAKSLNSKLNISFINTRSNWSATSSWKENVFSIFNSLTKVKNISFVTQVYNKEPQSVTILPFADSVPVSVITWTPFSSMQSIFVCVSVVWLSVHGFAYVWSSFPKTVNICIVSRR
jgi:hypothetical protein